jgi:hypothetical protein
VQAAEDYAHELQSYLGATAPVISDVKTREDKSPCVTVTAEINRGQHPLVERAAIILFINGVAIQMDMSASPEDARAGDEFQVIMSSVRLAPVRTGQRPLHREANDVVLAERYAGAALIHLDAEYQNVTMFKFRSADGKRHLSIRVDPWTGVKTDKAKKGLFAESVTTRDDLGRPFTYEKNKNLWKPRGSRPKSVARAMELTGLQPSEPTSSIEQFGQFGDAKVTIRVSAAATDSEAQDLAKTVLDSIKSEGAVSH